MAYIGISEIIPNEDQVRKSWNEEGITELAASIKDQGLIVPIKVRPTDNNHYEIIYGHRRYAAALLAGLDGIEAIVEEVDDADQLANSMIENMVREDMNDADISDGLIQLKEATKKTWTQIGAMFGKVPSWASELGSLTNKEKEIIKMSLERHLTIIHVRQIHAGIKEEKYQLLVLEKVGREGLSARQARIVAEIVAAALAFDGERGAMAELARPFQPADYSPTPEPTIEEKDKAIFNWWKDDEVHRLNESFSNFNNTITRLMNTEQDPEVARLILIKWRSYLSTWIARMPVK